MPEAGCSFSCRSSACRAASVQILSSMAFSATLSWTLSLSFHILINDSDLGSYSHHLSNQSSFSGGVNGVQWVQPDCGILVSSDHLVIKVLLYCSCFHAI